MLPFLIMTSARGVKPILSKLDFGPVGNAFVDKIVACSPFDDAVDDVASSKFKAACRSPPKDGQFYSDPLLVLKLVRASFSPLTSGSSASSSS